MRASIDAYATCEWVRGMCEMTYVHAGHHLAVAFARRRVRVTTTTTTTTTRARIFVAMAQRL
jgi:hypothetical protein